MAKRPCPKPGCPNLQPCADHKRPTASRRGYDAKHQRTRHRHAPQVATGTITCWRCGNLIRPDQAWDEGHIPGGGTAPEHAGPCNRADGGRRAHAG